MMNKWQHEVLTIDEGIVENRDMAGWLDTLSDEGWELITVVGKAFFFRRVNREWAIKKQEERIEIERRLHRMGVEV